MNSQRTSGQMSVIKLCVLQSKNKIKARVDCCWILPGSLLWNTVLEGTSGIFHLDEVVSVHTCAWKTQSRRMPSVQNRCERADASLTFSFSWFQVCVFAWVCVFLSMGGRSKDQPSGSSRKISFIRVREEPQNMKIRYKHVKKSLCRGRFAQRNVLVKIPVLFINYVRV